MGTPGDLLLVLDHGCCSKGCALQDKRLAWYDLDLSTKPYRALRYHSHALRSVAFHKKYPLFASASDDASVHIFHGMVYQVSPVLSSSVSIVHGVCMGCSWL